jgi:multidrug efflux system outer membrane protein
MTVACAGLVSACAMGPDYTRPEAELPEQFRLQPSTATQASIGDQGWWALYRDPNLSRLIETALERNFDVRIAATRIEQAQAELAATGYQLLPEVSAGGSAAHRQLSAYETAGDRTGDVGSLSVQMSYEIDFWGRLRRTREASRARWLSSEAARDTVRLSLVAAVATQYFTLLALDEQLDITRATLASRQEFLKLTQAQFERGTVSGLDVNTAKAQLATAQANVPDLERRIAQVENQLSLLLGGYAQVIQRPDSSAPLRLSVPEVDAGLPSTLLERRPDLRAAEFDLVAANASLGVAKAALFPTIAITGSYGSLSTDLSELLTGGAEKWSIGVNLLQPLLDADRNRYRVDYADAKRREALLQYEKSVRTAFKEVSDALIARLKTTEFESAQRSLVEAQDSAHEIALARYKVGYSSYFDVINADRDLFTAKLALSSASLASQLANVQLYQALGGGWQDKGAAAPVSP